MRGFLGLVLLFMTLNSWAGPPFKLAGTVSDNFYEISLDCLDLLGFDGPTNPNYDIAPLFNEIRHLEQEVLSKYVTREPGIEMLRLKLACWAIEHELVVSIQNWKHIVGLIHQESLNRTTAVSRVGAMGLTQVMPGTHFSYCQTDNEYKKTKKWTIQQYKVELLLHTVNKKRPKTYKVPKDFTVLKGDYKLKVAQCGVYYLLHILPREIAIMPNSSHLSAAFNGGPGKTKFVLLNGDWTALHAETVNYVIKVKEHTARLTDNVPTLSGMKGMAQDGYFAELNRLGTVDHPYKPWYTRFMCNPNPNTYREFIRNYGIDNLFMVHIGNDQFLHSNHVNCLQESSPHACSVLREAMKSGNPVCK